MFMAAKSSSCLQGVSAGLSNLNLPKKRGIDHEVSRIFSNGVMSQATPRQPSVVQVLCLTVNILNSSTQLLKL